MLSVSTLSILPLINFHCLGALSTSLDTAAALHLWWKAWSWAGADGFYCLLISLARGMFVRMPESFGTIICCEAAWCSWPEVGYFADDDDE